MEVLGWQDNRFLSVLVGSVFDWKDILCYVAGCILLGVYEAVSYTHLDVYKRQVLCMVLGMAGCGTNQENKEHVSGNVSVETENKENDDVVQNEQTADTGSYPPCVMVCLLYTSRCV